MPKTPAEPVQTPAAEPALVAFMYPNLGDAPVTIHAKDQAEADARAAKMKVDFEVAKAS